MILTRTARKCPVWDLLWWLCGACQFTASAASGDATSNGSQNAAKSREECLTSRFRQQPPRPPVDRFMKLEHHCCRPRPAPAAVPELSCWASTTTLQASAINLLGMKIRMITWLGLFLAAGIAGFLCHSWSVHDPRSRRIMVGRDLSDAAINPTRAKAEYDPYFDRVNHSADFVLSGTNPVTRNP